MDIIQPYNVGVAATKSDTVDLPRFTQNGRLTDAVQCGETGVVVIVFGDNSTQAFTVAAGQILPVAARRVNSTNTAGTLFVALYRI